MAFCPFARLRAWDRLDDRLVPALTFHFDYRYDSAGFFADPARRALLERAGTELGSRIESPLADLTPTSTNSWSASVLQPATQTWVTVDNLAVRSNEMVVFVGAGNAGLNEAAAASTGGYRASGSAAWLQTVRTRGHDGYANWGGSISFVPSKNWYFGTDAAGLASNQLDFATVATHELGHLLGFGTAPQFDALVTGDEFRGPAATRTLGSAPRLSPDRDHWAQGTTLAGAESSMQPQLVRNARYGYSELDYAALKDIGWSIAAASPRPVRAGTFTPVVAPASAFTVLSGLTGGLAQMYRLTDSGPVAYGPSVRPFDDFGGEIRGLPGDFTGDGVTDVAYVTGPGGGSRIRVLDGRTFADLTPSFSAFEASFTGGAFLAAADLNGDGRDDLIVSPDVGGGGRVSAFTFRNGTMTTLANFFGIDDPAFRGGARVAAADVTGDGRPDLVVAAGVGGGPRVAVFDGRFVAGAATPPPKALPDFFAFPGADTLSMRNGVFLAAGDFDGDGRDDLAFGGGPGGGPRVLAVGGAALTANPTVAVTHPLVNGFAFDPAGRSGVRLAAKTDAEGRPVLLATDGRHVASWTPTDGTWDPFGSETFSAGVFVG